jgi:hypothetical protein
MAKHEYEIIVKLTERYRVFVEADDWDEAESKAFELFNDGKVELEFEDVTAECNWSDEEDEVELPDEED